ncbi:MAG: transcription termination factor Rho [Ilumatobacteraceae bacterium]
MPARKQDNVASDMPSLDSPDLNTRDKDELLVIARALGIAADGRASKATLISRILESTGGAPAAASGSAPPAPTGEDAAAAGSDSSADSGSGSGSDSGSGDAPVREREVILGPDGEPLADWEVDLIRSGEMEIPTAGDDDGDEDDDGTGAEGGKRRRRRRKKKGGASEAGEGQNQAQPQGQGQGDRHNQAPSASAEQRPHREPEGGHGEPFTVSGHLDMRDEGYGFLRVNGYLPSRDDIYVSVRTTRQFGLRRGDWVEGMARPASRNEKNPALVEVSTVNHKDPGEARGRRRFDDLTAIFPDDKIRLESSMYPLDLTGRIIDLVAPIGKGQRGLIVSPPKAGKTSVMKAIAQAIEANDPSMVLMVVLIDERPEEVTDMRRSVKGEVVASTFDRPVDEHAQVAELALERAKRLVEYGKDVVMIVDGITRLTRAYNLCAPASGRLLSGGIDAAALYPPKRFLGAARNLEEGGSLTILATALVDTNSRMDDAIFEEFKGTGNMELRLDRRAAERRIFPAIDIEGSGTRHEELLFDRKQLQLVWKLRKVLSAMGADGQPGAALELLVDRMRSFHTNAEFLAEIDRQAGR